MLIASSTPVLTNERAGILDTLRGMAILGIFLNNVFVFTGYIFFNEGYRQSISTYPVDKVLSFLQTVFVEGKFYTLFSLLFGIGFSIILIRNEQRGVNPLKIFYRRLFILAIIGALHLRLLWEGDILLLYAIIGSVLPLFRKCSDKTLLIWATFLIASPILFDGLKIWLHFNPARYLENIAIQIDTTNGITENNFSQYLYSDASSWKEWRNWQATSFIYRYAYILETNRIPKVLGIFLVGFYAGRKMMYNNLDQYKHLFKRIAAVGFAIGLPASIGMAVLKSGGPETPTFIKLGHTALYAISVVPLSLAYVSVICLLWIKTSGNTRLNVFAPVGRMALTNYLSQTILSITIFFGVGFGVAGHIGPTIFIPIVVAIYFVQVIISNWWFRYFNYGPMEWLWRQLTYGKRLPIRK